MQYGSKKTLSNKNLPRLSPPLRLAKKVGKQLGGDKILQRAMSKKQEKSRRMTDITANQPNMWRDFSNRTELIDYLKPEFPEATTIDAHTTRTCGGRAAAETALSEIEPADYAKTRNYLDGEVTHLSPYIRHGVLSLAEVRDASPSRVAAGEKVGKLVTELAWRDYFQRVFAEIGDGIWHDQEPYKTGFDAEDYADELPDDIWRGATGLACIDAFSRDLAETGYLHNHARMWLAAYVVHWRRVKWQAGARWFLEHLLDGDPGSNNLSWQWVASTFSHKPYFFNRDNLEKFSNGRYCSQCPLRGHCDFEGDYPELERKLFPHKPPTNVEPRHRQPKQTGKRRRRMHQ